MEKGFLTSEFVLNILYMVGTFVLVLLEKDLTLWLSVGGLSTAAYTGFRTYRKTAQNASNRG